MSLIRHILFSPDRASLEAASTILQNLKVDFECRLSAGDLGDIQSKDILFLCSDSLENLEPGFLSSAQTKILFFHSPKNQEFTARDLFLFRNLNALWDLNWPISLIESLWAKIKSEHQEQIESELQSSRYQELYLLQKSLNKEWENLAKEDSLTGLPNKRALEEALRQEWARAKREKSELSLIVLDIDFFKKLNDHYGHAAGDDYLVKLAKIIRSVLRRPADFAARFGGEEFVVLLPQTALAGAKILAERLRQSVFEGTDGELSISLGVCSAQPFIVDGVPGDLFEAADAALYSAKANGRNQVQTGEYKAFRIQNPKATAELSFN